MIVTAFAITIFAGADANSDEPRREVVRILTYNIHHAAGVDRKLDLDRIATVIGSVNPDIVALQEVDQNVARSGKVDQPAELARLTKMHVAFGDNIRFGGGKYGNAILSRFPISRFQNHDLPNFENGEQRGVLVADIRIPSMEQPITFFATHFDHRPGDAERLASAEMINKLTKEQSGRLMLLAGDLNDTPESATLKRLGDHWTSVSTKELPTVPVRVPQRQIDFILFHPAKRWKVASVRVLPEATASDHRAVFSELKIR